MLMTQRQSNLSIDFLNILSFTTACRIIPNTDGVRKAFLKRYPNEDPSKFVVIPNGFDSEDLSQAELSDVILDNEKFNIVHTGSLGGMRNPKNFLIALSELIKEEKLDPNKLKLYLVGLIGKFNDGKTIDDYIEKFDLKNYVVKIGFISRQKAMAYNLTADLLLLIIGTVPNELLNVYGLSGKVYDYIISVKPIFSLAQKGGATYNFLEKYGIGLIADPLRVKDIKNKLLILYRLWTNGNLRANYNPADIKDYNMESLSKRLCSLFEFNLQKNI